MGRLDLLQELLPKAKRITVFSDTATAGRLRAVQVGAKRLGAAPRVLEFKNARGNSCCTPRSSKALFLT